MIDPKWHRNDHPRRQLCRHNQRMASHLSLVQSFGALPHAYIPERSNQVHRPMPKGQPLLALLAQVLGDP
jgi:hypothetical protein